MPDETIAEEWERYVHHFGEDSNPKNAFYMGAMTMLFNCANLPDERIRNLAAEIDRFLATDPCICDACAERRRNGTAFSIEQTLFGESLNG